MPNPSDKPGAPQARNSKVERALLLRDAVEHAVRVEREGAKPEARRGTGAGRRIVSVLCAALIGFSAYSFIAKPEFIWGSPVPTMSAERVEASLRVAMHLAARRAELHKAREGEYPETLAEFSPETTLRYRAVEDGFEITAVANGRLLVFRSGDDANAFLGDSRELIQQKVGR